MAKLTNGLKKIQRISSLTIRAIEHCFPDAEFSEITVEYKESVYRLKMDVLVFDDKYLKVEVKNLSADKCVKTSLEHVLIDLKYMIKQLQNEEKEVRKDIREYGVAFEESSAVTLSSTIMLRDVISSIKLN
ncbi:hypothetical protein ACQKDY_02890 [Alteromonas macleodii]|uniref:hypothetical protein n=1 Tax=Alteromonas macleodii TaxID=28108 RepID=UPI003D019F4A